MKNKILDKEHKEILYRSEGITTEEKYLKQLCEHTFLTLWSYPGIYRDQGVGKGIGKEVCDLLVVFENHIIIFSDKACVFPNSGDIELDWSRWYKRAIEKSADQVFGAERWIREYPNRLFLDKECQHHFPFELPDLNDARFHRIIVAHGCSERCKKELGGSGSLMIFPEIIGKNHFKNSPEEHCLPFTIGHVNPSKGFVHIFDDTTLDIVLKTLDTITDFTDYLYKKEQLITSGKLISAAGEEELLSYYLGHLNQKNMILYYQEI